MVNRTFPDEFGLGLLGLQSLSEYSEKDVSVIEVRADIEGAATCPACGREGFVVATRQSRYADIPRDGHPVVLAWRRRLFACRSCGETFREQLPALAEGRRVTRRLVDWLADEAAKRTFLDIARECGLSQRTVLSLLRSPGGLTAAGAVPSVLGLALVTLAGSPRPVVIDVGKAAVLEVYRSIAHLKDRFQGWGEASARVECLILDVGLDPVSAEIDAVFGKAERLADPSSAAREGASMMLHACGAAIAVSAKRQTLATGTLRILFNKDESSLGRVGRRRLLHPVDEVGSALRKAYELKEVFIHDLCHFWFDAKWSDWRRAARALADNGPAEGRSINYGDVITLFDSYSPALERYAKVKESYAAYEKLLADIRALPTTGTRSFKATRARVLRDVGRRPEPSL